ncbi:ORF364 [White spot syndrome virus]|uniref:Wsv331 n=3 Tax=White spot syndrome virus TaxID=342409 RepID=Q8VAR5_WSSVS|nr:wsv331 [Shrimp white spot syndrome virus]AFX59708.1 wsv331 [White spot syndrome virus]AAL33333.1 wsv331 [Shrimp white spot syndrome virus]AAL89255.1 WSSV387 [Shrimp white spot syndrome virus]ATU83973.1 ORF364 [White spot syndrome virus]AWQ60462.1 wsv331 [Shrimp white spot syndrome virus]
MAAKGSKPLSFILEAIDCFHLRISQRVYPRNRAMALFARPIARSATVELFLLANISESITHEGSLVSPLVE